MLLKSGTVKQDGKSVHETQHPDELVEPRAHPSEVLPGLSTHLPGPIHSNEDSQNAFFLNPVKQRRIKKDTLGGLNRPLFTKVLFKWVLG